MDQTGQIDLGAWQPLTFGGIAKFAHARTSRLAVVLLLFAAVNGVSLGWFLATTWSPVVAEAILELPAKGVIHNGVFNCTAPPRILAHRPSMAIALDMEKSDTIGQIADLQFNFARSSMRVESILGFVEFPYPTEWDIQINRTVLEPLWGAWHPFLLIIAGTAFGLLLIFIWAVLGLIYTPLALLGASVWRHPLHWGQAWRLSIAALMPGALWMSVVVVLYGLHQLNYIGLLVAFILHIVAGWFFLLFSPAGLKNQPAGRASSAETGDSPFTRHGVENTTVETRKKNPFQ